MGSPATRDPPRHRRRCSRLQRFRQVSNLHHIWQVRRRRFAERSAPSANPGTARRFRINWRGSTLPAFCAARVSPAGDGRCRLPVGRGGVAMWMLRWILTAVTLIAAAVGPRWRRSQKRNPSQEDRAELRMAQRQLHSRDETQRIEASSGSVPCPAWRPPRSSRPRAWSTPPATCGTPPTALAARKDDPEIGALLLRTLNRESRSKKKGLSCAVPLTMILLAAEPADTQRDLAKFLDAVHRRAGERRLAGRRGRRAGRLRRCGLLRIVAADDRAELLFEHVRLSPRGGPGAGPPRQTEGR